MSIAYFARDLAATCGNVSVATKMKWLLLSHTLHMTFLIRMGQTFRSWRLFGAILGPITEYIIRIIFASDISCKAKIGPGLTILHGHDIVIGADVVIGSNCKIFNGTTLGNRVLTESSTGNQPRIANNVTISTGAKILGNIFIGDNAIIGANSVVLINAPANSTIVGVPGKIKTIRPKN